MSIEIKKEFKDSVSKNYNRIKLLYLIFIHILAFAWSPYVKYTSDENGTLMTIDVPYIEYHKTIFLMDN